MVEKTEFDFSSFFNEFPIPSLDDWYKTVNKGSIPIVKIEGKGEGGSKRGEGKGEEEDIDISISPIYVKSDIEKLSAKINYPGFAPFIRGSEAAGNIIEPWLISQEYRAFSAGEINKILKEDLTKGLSAIHISLVQPDGPVIGNVQDLELMFKDIDITVLPLHIETGSTAFFSYIETGSTTSFSHNQAGGKNLPVLTFFTMLDEFLQQRNKQLNQINGFITFDPLNILLREGKTDFSQFDDYDQLLQNTRLAIEQKLKLQTIGIDARLYHQRGLNVVWQLAAAMATAIEYLKNLMKRGLTIDECASRVRFFFAVGSNFFLEIAKLRAARVMWSRIVATLGGSKESQIMHVHVSTSKQNPGEKNDPVRKINEDDPYTNILRSTTQALSAIVGGGDSIHVEPYNSHLESPQNFSRRIARNTQLILKEECHLNQVIDPVGGSYYLEWLTDQVAQKSWSRLQEIESSGGILTQCSKLIA